MSAIDAYFYEPDKAARIDSSRASADASTSTDYSCRSSYPGRGLREDDVVPLVRLYLQNVHSKNPIFDPASLIRMAKDVAEEGFQWSEQSCIVMLACALASLAMPFSASCAAQSDISYKDAPGYSTAEQYYVSARKRIMASLHRTLLSIDRDHADLRF